MPRRKMTEQEKLEAKWRKEKKHSLGLLERELAEYRERRIPKPAYIHKIGDRVRYGAWNFTEIMDILDGGKIYKCYSCTVNLNTNRGDVFGEKVHYLAWYEACFYRTSEEVEAMPILEEDDDIQFSYQNRDVYSLLGKMTSRYGIDLDPDYQRGNVWTLDQKVALIDSVFKNVDIGKFTVIRRPWGSDPNKPKTPFLYEMLDGKQRITALFEFYCGRFKYKGKYFYELHPMDQWHLKSFSISYAETEPITDNQKYRYFLKLNTTGTPVDPEHIEHVRQLWLKTVDKG